MKVFTMILAILVVSAAANDNLFVYNKDQVVKAMIESEISFEIEYPIVANGSEVIFLKIYMYHNTYFSF